MSNIKMNKYRVTECIICSQSTKKWCVCRNCGQTWCNRCNIHLEANGKSIKTPPEMHGRKKYSCPHCKYEYITGFDYLTPRTADTSCCIS